MRKLTTKDFIDRARTVHGDKYDYSKVEYINNKTKVCIICSEHGEFWQSPNNHLFGQLCITCGINKRTNEITCDINDFINKSNKIHNNRYDYSKVEYINNKIKVCIICPEHGVFWQRPDNHIGSKQGCPKCNSSKGELEILNILESLNINFILQHRFKDCRNKRPLPFDFYLPEMNTCIEYDGEQHYILPRNNHFGGIKSYTKRRLHDKIKTEYCKENNIRLIRIRYDEDIDSKLKTIKKVHHWMHL